MATVVAMKDRNVSIPSAEELVARARAMIPVLKERAKACTAARNVPAETVADMQAAGFFIEIGNCFKAFFDVGAGIAIDLL